METKSYRINAVIAGSLFLIAMAASLIGGSILEPILSSGNYLATTFTLSPTIHIGVILDMINAISVFGIAAALYPVIKEYKLSVATGYLGFRIIECVVCVLSVIAPLLIVNLSHDFIRSGILNSNYYAITGNMLLNFRRLMLDIFLPLFFCLGALLLYYSMYKIKFLPRFIAIWGFVGVLLIGVLNLMKVDMGIGMIFAFPIILNEIFMGLWMIVKGFNTNNITSKRN